MVKPTTTEMIKLDVAGLETLEGRIERARGKLTDLRPMWELFASDFYKDQKRTFQLKGPGRFKDLSPAYKIRKQRVFGFLYPILFAKGELGTSLLSRDAPGSILKIERESMTIGTAVAHGIFHHGGSAGRRKLPRRALFDESLDSPMFKRWERIADAFFEKAVQGAFDGK